MSPTKICKECVLTLEQFQTALAFFEAAPDEIEMSVSSERQIELPSRQLLFYDIKIPIIMTETPNPFALPLKTFWARLNSLNGLLFCLHSQLNDFRGMYKEALHKRGIGLEAVRGGTSLVVRDLSEWPDHGWAQYYSSGLFKIEGEEYLNLVEMLLQREATWTISQAFEAFETYLKDTTAAHLFENPNSAVAEKLDKFRAKHSGVRSNEAAFWRLYVDFTYRNAFELLKALRHLSPLLGQLEQDNNRALSLTSWLDVLAQVRHATVHSNGILRQKQTSSWTPEKLRILEIYFKAKPTVHGYETRYDIDDVEKILVIAAEYGYIVFKALSEASAYPYESTLKPESSSPMTGAPPES